MFSQRSFFTFFHFHIQAISQIFTFCIFLILAITCMVISITYFSHTAQCHFHKGRKGDGILMMVSRKRPVASMMAVLTCLAWFGPRIFAGMIFLDVWVRFGHGRIENFVQCTRDRLPKGMQTVKGRYYFFPHFLSLDIIFWALTIQKIWNLEKICVMGLFFRKSPKMAYFINFLSFVGHRWHLGGGDFFQKKKFNPNIKFLFLYFFI